MFMDRKEALLARAAIQRAIRRGKITRPNRCERCGLIPPLAKDGRKQIHGHHQDYSRPLEVRWLCQKHHMEEHRVR